MSHTKRRLSLSGGLALIHLLLFCLHLTAASYIESDGLVRWFGYGIDLLLVIGLALAGAHLLMDLTAQTKREKYLLPALPFLARILYYAPYHTVDFTLNEQMLTAAAIPLALLLALLENALLYGAFLLIFYFYRRALKSEMNEEAAALIASALPLIRSLVLLLVSLVTALLSPSANIWGGVLLDYLVELLLVILAAVLSYFTIRYAQGKLS